MEKIVLKCEKREAWENLKTLRASRIIPAVVYGHKQKATSIKLDSSCLLRAYRLAWENHVIELEVDGKKIDTLFHEVQKDPISWDIIHVDFYAITKGEKVHTYIPLNFVWSSKAKTEEWAIIEELVKQLEVKCLPIDLVDSIEVDLSMLEKTWDNIKVSDLKVSPKIEILNSKDEVVAVAAKPKVEKIEDTAPVMELPADAKEEKSEE
jgi:large subunit ribosomal protein L25